MGDDVMFEARLAEALGRYADLAPAMDDVALARQAAASGRSTRWPGWLFSRGSGGLNQGRPAVRIAWLLVVLALAFVTILFVVVGGAFRRDSRGPIARNGVIAFTAGGNDHGAPVTHMINPDGTGDRPVEAGRCPTYAHDGSVLAWLASGDSASLVVAGVDGKPVHTVLLVESPLTSVVWAVSPDGSRVAWFKPSTDVAEATAGERLELWVAPVAGGPAVRILPASRVPNELRDSLWWSPDGRHIAFGTSVLEATTGEHRRTAIELAAVDGSGLHTITNRLGSAGDEMSWSPDGQSIVYVGVPDALPGPTSTAGATPDPSPARDLFVIGVDGADDRHLTDSLASESDPSWSPDGASLAFLTTADDGVHRLTTIRMNGPTPAGPPVLGPESPWFVWSPDGTRLLWLELTTVATETYRSTLHSIDRDFREVPTALQVIDGQIVCRPSWQRLEP